MRLSEQFEAKKYIWMGFGKERDGGERRRRAEFISMSAKQSVDLAFYLYIADMLFKDMIEEHFFCAQQTNHSKRCTFSQSFFSALYT